MPRLGWTKGEFVSPRFINSLTGIRAVAALWVLFGHYSNYLLDDFGVPVGTIFQPIFDSAWVGVDLFFVLSGFIIAHTYLDEFKANKFKSSSNFWWKRISRLYPVYLLTTLATTLLFLVAISIGYKFNHGSGEVLTWGVFVTNILGVQEWIGYPSINQPSWSVSAEFFAYLIFPVLAVLFLRVNNRVVLLSLGLACVGFLFFESAITFVSPRIWQVVFEFSLGALVYKGTRGGWLGSISFRSANAVRPACWVLAIVLLYFAGLNHSEWHAPLALVFAILIWLYSLPGEQKSVLATPVFITLGLWSYSLYLVHMIVKNVITAIGVPVSSSAFVNALIFLGLLALPIGVSGLTYRFVEVPGRNILNRHPWLRKTKQI